MKRILLFSLAAALMICGIGSIAEAPAESDSAGTAPNVGISAGDYSMDFSIASVGAETSEISTGDYSMDFSIANVDVEKPVIGINEDSFAIDIPEISDCVTPEVNALYTDLVPYLDEVQLAELNGMTAIEAADYAQLQYDVTQVLADEFKMAGIDVSFNASTGAIVLSSSVLYATDSYQITDAGKSMIREVMRVMVSVLGRDEYRDSVAQIVVAGHTDTDGSHNYNQQLSERRANGVKDFCLSAECGLDNTAWLSSVLTAKGYSYDHLIYNADGSENKDASRRVEIRFLMKV